MLYEVITLFLHDEAASRVYLIGSRGYDRSGIGSEIPLGRGIVGIAAAECAPIRITHHAEEFRYGRITSYNVCYTKLLRSVRPPGRPAPPRRGTRV